MRETEYYVKDGMKLKIEFYPEGKKVFRNMRGWDKVSKKEYRKFKINSRFSTIKAMLKYTLEKLKEIIEYYRREK